MFSCRPTVVVYSDLLLVFVCVDDCFNSSASHQKKMKSTRSLRGLYCIIMSVYHHSCLASNIDPRMPISNSMFKSALIQADEP